MEPNSGFLTRYRFFVLSKDRSRMIDAHALRMASEQEAFEHALGLLAEDRVVDVWDDRRRTAVFEKLNLLTI